MIDVFSLGITNKYINVALVFVVDVEGSKRQTVE